MYNLYRMSERLRQTFSAHQKTPEQPSDADRFFAHCLAHFFTTHPSGIDDLNIMVVRDDKELARYDLTRNNRLQITPYYKKNPLVNITLWDSVDPVVNIHFVDRGSPLPKNPLPVTTGVFKLLKEIAPDVARLLDSRAVDGWFRLEQEELEIRFPYTNPDVLGP